MSKLGRSSLVVGALLVMGTISTTVVVAKKPSITAETLEAESEILAIHYQAAGLQMTTRAEQREEDSLEDESLWAKILISSVSGMVEEDPDAESAEQVEKDSEDPIRQIKKGFVSSLQADPGLENIRSIEKPQRRRYYKVKSLKKKFPETTILDFITTSIILYPSSPHGSRYRLRYTAEARLIHPQIRRPAWSANCHYSGRAHRLEKFAEDKGALLKAELETAAEGCVETLYSRFLDKIE